MMNAKERLRLKEFRNYVDFLDNSQDIQVHGRFIDTLQALYEDGWFDWIYLYAKEQTERVQELEDKLARIRFVNNDYDKQNKRYHEALVKLRNDIGKIKTGYEKNVFVIKTVDDALIDWEALEGKK